MYEIAKFSGWLALVSFITMLFTCICSYGCERYLTRKTKTRVDDYLLSTSHKYHKFFVWLTIITITIHVIAVELRL